MVVGPLFFLPCVKAFCSQDDRSAMDRRRFLSWQWISKQSAFTQSHTQQRRQSRLWSATGSTETPASFVRSRVAVTIINKDTTLLGCCILHSEDDLYNYHLLEDFPPDFEISCSAGRGKVDSASGVFQLPGFLPWLCVYWLVLYGSLPIEQTSPIIFTKAPNDIQQSGITL